MELPEVKREELLIVRDYLIVCYRNGKPCTFQLYNGTVLANNMNYFTDGPDANGKPLTYKFFLLPETVR